MLKRKIRIRAPAIFLDMGETIEFTAADGRTVGGYLARGPEGSPGVVVIQEWWGVNAQI